jgi:hypothetical protein
VGVRIVPKLDDAGVPIESRLDDPALHAAPAAVHETHFAKAGNGGRLEVLAYNRRDVVRRKRVKIELGSDRNADRIVAHTPSAVGDQLSALSG